jgi:predicted nucleotidyltransferase
MDCFVELRENILPLLRLYVKRIAVFGLVDQKEEMPENDIDLLVNLKPLGQRSDLGSEMLWNRS